MKRNLHTPGKINYSKMLESRSQDDSGVMDSQLSKELKTEQQVLFRLELDSIDQNVQQSLKTKEFKSRVHFFLKLSLEKNTFIWTSALCNDLKELIQECNIAYFNLSKSLISDADYDILFSLLTSLVKQVKSNKISNLLLTKQVGSGLVDSIFLEVIHDPPMLSLDKAYDFKEVLYFFQKVEKMLGSNVKYCVLPKFDGLAVELEYRSGILFRCSTRGDAKKGEDITKNVISYVKNIPKKILALEKSEYLSIRGECIMKKTDFLLLNSILEKNGSVPFATPRNTVAGTLRQKEHDIDENKKIYFYPYSIGKIESSCKIKLQTQTQTKLLQMYKSLGFETENYFPIIKTHLDDQVKLFYTTLYEKRSSIEYDMDGIVIAVDNLSDFHLLGATSRFPRGSIAWKFPSQKALTQLLDVSYQLGRTGVLTPVAELTPINIGGIIVKRATLHNLDEIKRLDIYLRDYVEVSRAGDVIPKIDRVVLQKREATVSKIEIPTSCFVCDTKLKQDSHFIICPNVSCPGVYEQYLKYFVSKDAWDIRGLGKELVVKMYREGLISDIADLFFLSVEALKNSTLERMGDQLASNIISEIQKRKEVSLACFLSSMNIHNVGKETAEILANHYKTLEALENVDVEEIQNLHGIGERIAFSLVTFLQSTYWKNLCFRLMEAGVKVLPLATSDEKNLAKFFGKVFVFTGTLSISRNHATNIIKTAGGKVSSSVSTKTSYLVYGENPSTKLEKAQNLNVKILTENEFQEMIED